MEQVATGADNSKGIDAVNDYILSLSDPIQYAGSEGLEVRHARQFEQACIALKQYTITDPKRLTVFEFYERISTIKKQAKKQRGKSN